MIGFRLVLIITVLNQPAISARNSITYGVDADGGNVLVYSVLLQTHRQYTVLYSDAQNPAAIR